jgi:hypothetical protein
LTFSRGLFLLHVIDHLEGGERLEDFLQDFRSVARESAPATFEEAKPRWNSS